MEDAAQREEGLMDLGAAFIADRGEQDRGGADLLRNLVRGDRRPVRESACLGSLFDIQN
jgi:hypothetical protein